VPDGDAPERNKAAARAEFEIWSGGELDDLDDLVAAEVVHHDPYDPNAADGIAGLKRSIELNRAAFPDMKITVEDQLAEGDRVATRWRATMTHSGSLGTTPPSGERVEMRGITIERFEDGKVVESWRSMDTLGLLRQIGALPS
jgi:steroid delta-isomerase-like uncharacterized protein